MSDPADRPSPTTPEPAEDAPHGESKSGAWLIWTILAIILALEIAGALWFHRHYRQPPTPPATPAGKR